MNIKYAFGIMIISFLFACQSDPNTNATDAVAQTTEVVDNVPKADGAEETMFDTNEKPQPGINGPETAQVKRVVRILTTEMWYVEAFIRGNEQKAEQQGRWYKFYPDFKYEKGKWDETTEEGKWAFTGQTAHLHLDAGTDLKSAEFKIMLSKDENVAVFIGTERYLQNNVQMKLKRFPEKITSWPK